MSLILGMIAALAWGIHDICVRHVSQTAGIFSSIITVLAFGCLLVVPASLFSLGAEITDKALTLSLLGGVVYGFAVVAHYKAFSIGPVRLVAPVIGAYPILSVIWAVMTGSEISLLHWICVGLVVGGVAYVAVTGDDGNGDGSPREALIWSILAGSGFALTFAIGQSASSDGGELVLLTPTRLAALVTVLMIAILGRISWRSGRSSIPLLATMGLLDATALGAVISSGGLENPEFASVAASTFGVITIVLAAIFLRERMTISQWGAVGIVFSAIAYLGL